MLIAGMNYEQRERMLQLEINNLIDKKDEMSMGSLHKKLSASSSPVTAIVASRAMPARQFNHDERLRQLKGIYSEYRLDGNSQHKYRPGMSPRSHANELVFDANQILKSDIKDAEYAVVG